MATEKQVKYVQSLQKQYNINKYTKEQISNMSHQEIESLVIKLRNEVKMSEMNRKAWKDQVNMWKEFE